MTSPVEDIPLVTLENAARQLRVDLVQESPANEAELELEEKLLQASAIVLRYIKRPDDHGWDAATAPKDVQAAVILVLRVLYDDPTADPITPGVKSLLSTFWDPAIA